MYYFFGASNNGRRAVSFWRKENIKAVIDNNEEKVGNLYEGIKVISFEEFKKEYAGEKIIITAFVKSDEICIQLEQASIHNYFVCPFMQSGFPDCSEIINSLDFSKEEIIAANDDNPVIDRILEELENENYKTIRFSDTTGLDIKADIFLTAGRDYIKQLDCLSYKKIVDINEELKKIKEKKYLYLKKYKQIHEGEKCFLIGNGPSLRCDDLDKIYEKQIKSIGCNGIFRIFENVKWRPDYYVIGDGDSYKRDMNGYPLEQIYFIRDFGGNGRIEGNVIWYPSNGERYYPGYPSFSTDLVQGTFGGRSVTYEMLQIAVYMGFKEIYLLGVDFSWGEDGRDTHFCKDYMDDRLVYDAMKYKEEQRHAYISARRYADAHGIKIYNATRGGYLEVFERVDFDKIFE